VETDTKPSALMQIYSLTLYLPGMYNDIDGHFYEVALLLYDRLHIVLTVICTVAEYLQSDSGLYNKNYILF
jgi:hypothetical protein